MSTPRIGDLLRRHIPLSTHDIEEILHEQSHSGRRFGDVALTLGLCSPQDVWRAWCEQVKETVERFDLDEIGIDAQSARLLPPDLARQFNCVAVRSSGTHLVLATTEEAFDEAAAELPQRLSYRVRFVIAPRAQIARALDAHYPSRVAG